MHIDMPFVAAAVAGSLAVAAPSASVAQSVAALKGDARAEAIARQVNDADSGWGDEVVTGVLTIRSADGATAERQFEMHTLEKNPGGDKRAVVFRSPRDLAGFVSLTHSEILDADQQWIFLPQFNRTRRLSARDKTGAFAGSEFSYEDIVRWELEKYDYGYVGTDDCGASAPCQVIADLPRYEYSGYSKLIESIDMEILQPRKIVYHDTAGRPFKTLEFFDYQQHGTFWRPGRAVMTNTITGAVSEIDWSGYRFGTGLGDSDFRVERIEAWAR